MVTHATAEHEDRVFQVYRTPNARVPFQWSFYPAGTNPKLAMEIPQNAVPIAIRQRLIALIGE